MLISFHLPLSRNLQRLSMTYAKILLYGRDFGMAKDALTGGLRSVQRMGSVQPTIRRYESGPFFHKILVCMLRQMRFRRDIRRVALARVPAPCIER